MHAFAHKNRRPKFDLVLKIIDLNNVPLVSGTSFIKWHLPSSTSAEHRGRTDKCQIRDHKVSYDYSKDVPVRMTVDGAGNLKEAQVQFEVVQEYASSHRGERILLGHVRLNLAEYVDPSEYDGADGICRRYLMQDSKINSTLKIGINMKLVEGDRNFNAPPLKTAAVFGGIAGIMAGEQGDSDDVGHMPSLSSKSREHGEVQDMYRRNLVAYWAAQPGELRADECIEDIFSGGDGWGPNAPEDERPPTGRLTADDANKPRSSHRHTASHDSSRHASTTSLNTATARDRFGSIVSQGVAGRTSLQHQASELRVEADGKQKSTNSEKDEFELREDLRSWTMPRVAA
ncbi:MAG: hypothetical protein M1828_005899 [Chrysothrix sp. TS-e1954]|nr:MAG: hypothetical protein M1828_005899 [Chrysothrix sp. TS-e1954]